MAIGKYKKRGINFKAVMLLWNTVHAEQNETSWSKESQAPTARFPKQEKTATQKDHLLSRIMCKQ